MGGLNDCFKSWDEWATLANVKRLLRQYHTFKLELATIRLNTSLSGVTYDGMPHSITNVNGTEESLVNELAKEQRQRDLLTHQIAMVDGTLTTMHDIDDWTSYLATVIEYRYIKRWRVVKCCMKLGEQPYIKEQYDGTPLPKTTFNDHQNSALLAFARIYPDRKQLIAEKVRS